MIRQYNLLPLSHTCRPVGPTGGHRFVVCFTIEIKKKSSWELPTPSTVDYNTYCRCQGAVNTWGRCTGSGRAGSPPTVSSASAWSRLEWDAVTSEFPTKVSTLPPQKNKKKQQQRDMWEICRRYVGPIGSPTAQTVHMSRCPWTLSCSQWGLDVSWESQVDSQVESISEFCYKCLRILWHASR